MRHVHLTVGFDPDTVQREGRIPSERMVKVIKKVELQSASALVEHG